MKKQELKRRISAWILLVALLPIFLLAAQHTHESVTTAGDNCTACVNHQPHSGHLSASTSMQTECVLCQFFSLEYLEGTVVALAIATIPFILTRQTVIVACPTRPLTLHASRAPPFLL